MSSRQHLDALAAARAHNATLRRVILLVAAMGAAGMYFAHALPKNLELHLTNTLGMLVGAVGFGVFLIIGSRIPKKRDEDKE